eukprot:1894594-Amphidinium_carterae.1
MSPGAWPLVCGQVKHMVDPPFPRFLWHWIPARDAGVVRGCVKVQALAWTVVRPRHVMLCKNPGPLVWQESFQRCWPAEHLLGCWLAEHPASAQL